MASSWTWASVAYSEALVDGLQRALWAVGGVPRPLLLDYMSAATHELRGRALRATIHRPEHLVLSEWDHGRARSHRPRRQPARDHK
ncbi:MAG: hypothetical protein IPK80_20745 [Nannocystis sp.]|nr:hypothetical protein [Nannocystis sp.]MBK8263750.1 hypothetical protein [Nannocystis sp.]